MFLMTEYNFHQGFERLANAWSGKGDRPPVFAQLHEFALRQSGESGKKFYQNPEIFVKGILNTSKNISLDIPDIVWDAYNLEAEALGVKVFFEDNASPALDQTPIIENEKDLAALKIPDPEVSGRYGFANAHNPRTGWVSEYCLAIDTGITLLMAENTRSGYVWNTFMKHPAAVRAFERAGFKPNQK